MEHEEAAAEAICADLETTGKGAENTLTKQPRLTFEGARAFEVMLTVVKNDLESPISKVKKLLFPGVEVAAGVQITVPDIFEILLRTHALAMISTRLGKRQMGWRAAQFDGVFSFVLVLDRIALDIIRPAQKPREYQWATG